MPDYPTSIFSKISPDRYAQRVFRVACTVGLIVGLLVCISCFPGKRNPISLPLAGFIFCIYGFLCIVDRESALGILVLFLPLQNKVVRGLPVTITDLMILELALVIWFRVVMGGTTFRFRTETRWLHVWMIVLFISSMVSMDPGLSLRLWIRTAMGMVVLLIVQEVIHDRSQLDRLILWAILSGLFLAAYGLGEGFIRANQMSWHLLGRFNNWIRIQSFVVQSNFLAWWLVLLVPWVISAIRLSDTPRDRIVWWLAMLVVVSVVLLTFSRGGCLALAIVFLFVPISRKIKIAGVIGLVALILVSAPMLANLKARGLSVERRFHRYLSAPSLTAHHPLWGYGLGTYKFLDRYEPGILPPDFKGKYSHSLYITLAVETGLISTVVFGMVLFQIGRNVYRTFRLPGALGEGNRIRMMSLVAAVVGLLILELFHSSMQTLMLWVWLAVFQTAPAVLISDLSESPVPV
ncbi:MAG: hypothetical protein GX455_15015 [Phycisphaerae bacterium]|nr:hypothetical protein [Phycisphaerae bacterium]